MAKRLNNPAVPALPVAPPAYNMPWGASLLNVLRLYFNQLKAVIDYLIDALATFEDGDFGYNILFPNIGAYYYPDQYATGNNIPTVVLWSATSSLYEFTLNPNNTATATYAGVYKITYSLQLANDDNVAHDVICWLRINGSTSANDVPDSSTIFTIPARKSAGVPSYVGAYSEVVFELAAGDSVGLWWGTPMAATSGGITGTWIASRAAQVLPMPYPETPSAIGSITFVSKQP
jgi:hypothetical protein